MEKLIDKISSYNILNYFIPGFLLVLCASKSGFESYVNYDNGFVMFVCCYICGIFISRIGSLFIEPLLRRIKFIKFSNIDDYINASRKDNKIEILMETANMYRNIATASLLIMIISSIHFVYTLFIVSIVAFVIFLMSYRKQVSYVVKRTEFYKNAKK